jgi:methyl-accepting chemotaxis protein
MNGVFVDSASTGRDDILTSTTSSTTSLPQNIPPSPPRTNGSGSSYLDAYDNAASLLSTSPTGGNLQRMTTGKSGRVIEKLMAENDRLRRELKVETTAREEERKAKEAIRQARDSLQSTNDNLILQNNIDKSSLARKDRKIEELKTHRDFERDQRVVLQERSKIQIKESDELVQDLKSSLSREISERKRAVNQYDVVRESFKRMDDGYRQRVERLKAQLDALLLERERDRQFLQRLEVTVEQQRQELEKLRLAKNKITEKYEDVLERAEEGLKDITQAAKSQELILEETTKEARSTLGALRHLIGVHNAFTDFDGNVKTESSQLVQSSVEVL